MKRIEVQLKFRQPTIYIQFYTVSWILGMCEGSESINGRHELKPGATVFIVKPRTIKL